MKTAKVAGVVASAISFAALACLFGAVLAYSFNVLPLAQLKAWLLVATIVWFVVTPFWMDRHK